MIIILNNIEQTKLICKDESSTYQYADEALIGYKITAPIIAITNDDTMAGYIAACNGIFVPKENVLLIIS